MQLDFERLFDALPSPYMVLDAKLNYITVNAEYERVTMRPAGEYPGRFVFEMFPNEGESGRRLRDSFERVLATGQTDSIAYLPYDIPLPPELGGGMERRFWTCHHTPILDDDGVVAFIIQNTVDVTEVVRLTEVASVPFGATAGATRLLERAREVEEQRKALLAESDEFRRLFQQAPGFFAVLSGPEHVFTFANDAYVRLVGGRDVTGRPIREALPDIAGQGFYEMLDDVYTTGRSTGGEAMRVVLQRDLDAAPKEVFLDFSYDAIRDRDGNVSGVFVQGMDRTEAVRTQQRQRLLLDELNHRVKNTLATVQSLASQTLRSARDLASARSDFEARILALSKTHNLLSAQEWESTRLPELLASGFSAYDAARVSAEGPPVMLTPKASISLALVVHELATNAAKYGALSEAGGSVRVRWRLEEGDGPLVLEWAERGGPPVTAPERRGFGSRIIGAIVTGELGGSFEPAYDPAGFSCRIVVSTDAVMKG